MRTAEIQFSQWLPDQPDYKNPGLEIAENCYPTAGGYSPFLGATAQGDTNTEAVQGAKQFFRSDETSVIVGGSSTRLFVLVGGTLTATTGLSAIGANEYWDFCRFNEYIFATSVQNSTQYLTDIESDTTWSAAAGSPPQARYCARVGNHVVLANLGSGLPYSFQSSAENDPTDWPTPGSRDARLKSSLRGTVQQEYGPITGITGDRYPLLFQERAVSRFDPVGVPTVFRIGTSEEARGAIAPKSIVTVGFTTYFLAHDGFWATDGNQIIGIGSQRVNEWFLENASQTNMFRTHGAVNWDQKCIVWSFYPDSDATGFKRQIIYNFVTNQWSTASLEVDYMVENKVGGTTLESWDSTYTSGMDNEPEASLSVDSTLWDGRGRVLSAFIQNASSESEMNLLNGTALAATFETGDFQPQAGKRAAVNAIYPIVENADTSTQAQLITREYKDGTPTVSSATTINAAGFCPVRGDGRFIRARVLVPAAADWDKMQAIQAESRVSGKR